MKKIYLLIIVVLFGLRGVGQTPLVLYKGTNVTTPNATNDRFLLNNFGAFSQCRFQANTTQSSSWAFHVGSIGSPNYNPCWRPNNPGETMTMNTFIPTSFNNGAGIRFNSGSDGGYNVTTGNYYTWNVSNINNASQVMQVLETSYNPKNIVAITRTPNLPNTNNPLITVEASSNISVGEFFYVRYTTDGFATSSLLQLTDNGANYADGRIPCLTVGATVRYYVFSSNKTLTQINADVTAYGNSAYDMSTLNLINNGGLNYSYTANASYTWLGVNANWDDAANWCGGVPTSTSNVTIPIVTSGLYPILSSGNASVNNVDIQSGGPSITVNGTGIFNLYGQIDPSSEAIDLREGTLNLAGTSGTQTLAGDKIFEDSIKNINIGNSVNLTVQNIKVTDNLTFSGTGRTLNTNGFLVLGSTSESTAHLGNTTGNTINGEVEIHRYLFARRAWRLLATPIVAGTGQTINQSWREDDGSGGGGLGAVGLGTNITGPVGPFANVNPFPSNVLDEYTLRGSMKYYSPSIDNYIEITNNELSQPLARNEGYYVFVRGDKSRTSANGLAANETTLRLKGNLRTGTQTFNIPADKFISVGNPFTSRIDMRTATYGGNAVEQFYLWNPNGGFNNVGVWQSYIKNSFTVGEFSLVGGGGLGGVSDNYIESGQAFFVQSFGGPGTLTIPETAKITGSENVSRAGVTIPTLEIKLLTKNANGVEYEADATILNFGTNLSNIIDNKDVRKISNTVDNISIQSNNQNLVVERRAPLTETDSIKLNIAGMRVASYKLEIDPSVLSNTGLTAYLKDKFLQTDTELSLTDVTNYNFDITSNTASRAADRFMIVFKANPAVQFANISATRNTDKNVMVKWAVQNEVKVQSYTIEQSNNGINFTTLGNATPTGNNANSLTYSFEQQNANAAKNWYRVKANVLGGQAKTSAIAQVNELVVTVNNETGISINPNPVAGHKINLQFLNKKGNYIVNVFANNGSNVLKTNLRINNEQEVKTLTLPSTLAQGNYNLVLLNEAGETVENLSFLLQ
jgi:hypothetical protein